jgi:hypothetical protein
VRGWKVNGGNHNLDVQVTVVDELGNPATAATVNVTAVNRDGSWSGTLINVGGGVYQSCNVHIFDDQPITINATATETGYISGSGSTTSITDGSLC